MMMIAIPALAACSAPAPATPAAPAVPKDAVAVLAASTSGLAAGNYAYKNVQPGRTVIGVADLPDHAWSVDADYPDPTEPMAVKVRVIGNDQYSQDGRPKSAWNHLDLSRLSQAARARVVPVEPDRTGATALLQTVQSATMNGSVITGKLDVFQLRSESVTLSPLRGRLFLPSAFTAQLDEQGRLIRLTLDLPASLQPKLPAGTWTLDITGYGTATPPEKPATFTEQPDSVYTQ